MSSVGTSVPSPSPSRSPPRVPSIKHFNLPEIRYNSTRRNQGHTLLQLNETNNSYKKKDSSQMDLFSPQKYRLYLNQNIKWDLKKDNTKHKSLAKSKGEESHLSILMM